MFKNVVLICTALFLFSCDMMEPNEPSYEDYVYHKYLGFHSFVKYPISNSPESKTYDLCTDQNSFVELNKDGTINIRISGMESIIEKPFFYENSGTYIITNTYHFTGGGLFSPQYWTGILKITLKTGQVITAGFKSVQSYPSGYEMYFPINWMEIPLEEGRSLKFERWRTEYIRWSNCQ